MCLTLMFRAMNVIDEIKRARQQLVSEEQKKEILSRIKTQLIEREYAIVDGARHYKDQEWRFGETYIRAPYRCHAAISEWLQELGFKTSRYYNKGGVDNGLQVCI